MRKMINNFNKHYLDYYTPSWISCLNELMNSFLDNFFPGFISVPRKPHLLGNEYYRIEDGYEGNTVMYRNNIQEGKDCLKDANAKWVLPSKFEGEKSEHGEEVH